MNATPLVLASASPRRRAILTQLGLPFEAVATDADETPTKGVTGLPAVLQIAERKLDAYLRRPGARKDAFILAIDTDVFLNGRLLGKPEDAERAERMLGEMQGKVHVVYSGIVVQNPKGQRVRASEATSVRLTSLTPAQIHSYVATKEPLDKAGGYGVQGQAAAFIEQVHGDYTNAIGLPIRATLAALQKAGFPLPTHLQPS